ncbi:hypothetical protein JVU11DRAFT_5575, partial [Chiua virens]
PGSRLMSILPTTFQRTQQTVTCYDYLGRPQTHGLGQRYLSPTTGVCRKLTVQAVHPMGPHEHHINDHMGRANKIGLWLAYTNPFRGGIMIFLKWIGTWLLFSLKLLWFLLWIIIAGYLFVQAGIPLSDDPTDDSEVYNTGRYKSYIRPFRNQLWEARSRKEFSSRSKKTVKGRDIRLHALYPRVLMLHDSTQARWIPCEDRDTIIRTKYIAISYFARDMYNYGPNLKREKEEFKEEVRAAVTQQNFDAYWLDLECLSDEEEKKKVDLFCMADVYRNAEKTLIVLGKSEGKGDENKAWERWGDRVWTFPEALLSRDLCCMVRGRTKIGSVTLHQLANLAYLNHEKEQAIVNAYSGKDPLERLERLSLLKAAIFRRHLRKPENKTSASGPSSSNPDSNTGQTSQNIDLYAANRVYALMGFFEHRIEPDYEELEMCALARLSMANDSDSIAERMVSLLPPPSRTETEVSWYADEDIYQANLWDILPEVQVAGITEGGALILDGCKAACIRWKDFPEVASMQTDSIRRALVGLLPYFAWPAIIGGIATRELTTTSADTLGGTVLFVCGIVLLLMSPRLFAFSEQSRVVDAQPWLIGVKGILDSDEAALRIFPGGNKGPHYNIEYTPSGSPFAIYEEGRERAGSKAQYNLALRAEQGEYAGRMYTLIDTWSATIYYFSAEKPPTVCLFTGREGGMGRFVLCSETCYANELHKETVLRMPTEVSEKMDLGGWVAVK